MDDALQVKQVMCDGTPIMKFKCPGCRGWGQVDDDQYHGRVSILCGCGFHETIDLSKKARIKEEA